MTRGRDEHDDGERHQPYDGAMRLWGETFVVEVARWLDPAFGPVAAGEIRAGSADLPAGKIEADLVIEAGQLRLQLEYETGPRRSLVVRLLNYRARLMARNSGARLSQHVLVLGDGDVTGLDDPRNGFTLYPNVIYLRESDASGYLGDPLLAPLAVLCRGSTLDREGYLAEALAVIHGSGRSKVAVAVLVETALTLAGIRLDRETIIRIEKEADMRAADWAPLVDYWRDMPMGRQLRAEGWREGQARGEEEGRARGEEEGRVRGEEEGRVRGEEEGRVRGREQLLLALLAVRFGDRPEVATVARRLAAWPESAAARAIQTVDDLNELLTARPPA